MLIKIDEAELPIIMIAAGRTGATCPLKLDQTRLK